MTMHDEGSVGRIEAALRQALPLWGLDRDATLGLLTVSENATFLAETPHGRKVVFRVHRPGYHDPAEIRSELAWIAAVRRDGAAPTAEPLQLRAGGFIGSVCDGRLDRHVVAFSFVPGREPVPGAQLAGWYRVLGGLTAALHNHARRWQRPDGFRRKVWTADSIAGEAGTWGRWQNAHGIGAVEQAVLARALARLRAELVRYGRGRDTFGLIHCDLRPANLLVEGDTLAVIDFDDCGFGWFMYDFATSVSFMEHEPFIPELEAAWLDGYAAATPVTAADVAMLPSFRMLRRLQLLAWTASHAETPTAQRLGTDFAADTAALADIYLSTHDHTAC